MYFKVIKSVKKLSLLIDFVQSQLIEMNLRLEELENSRSRELRNNETNWKNQNRQWTESIS